jgi:hypothetical protein
LLLLFFVAYTACAQPLLGSGRGLEPSAAELTGVESVNRAYSDAYNKPREDNWVLEKIATGTLGRGCWVNEHSFYPVGTHRIFDGLAMQCIEIGKSSRLFWPTRWAEYCRQIGLDYGNCMLTRIRENK